MDNAEIKAVLDGIVIGDKLAINDWRARYTVCGISPNFILAHYGQSYTILPKQPNSVVHNGIRCGDYCCGPDWWIFGYAEGYRFTDRDWVAKYLSDLEDGTTEVSMKRRALLYFISVVGHTDKVYQNKGVKVLK